MRDRQQRRRPCGRHCSEGGEVRRVHTQQRGQPVPGSGRVGQVHDRCGGKRPVAGAECSGVQAGRQRVQDLVPHRSWAGERSARAQQAALKVARASATPACRTPQTVPQRPVVDTNLVPSSNLSGGMSALNAAMPTCGAIYSGELGLAGQDARRVVVEGDRLEDRDIACRPDKWVDRKRHGVATTAAGEDRRQLGAGGRCNRVLVGRRSAQAGPTSTSCRGRQCNRRQLGRHH